MASTSALFSGLTGLTTNSRRLEVIGNNISNANTTAFKSNRLQFSAAFNRTFSLGTSPSGTTGGTNPGQIGLGATTAGTQRNNNEGAINSTGVATDLAIEGNGYFIVDDQGSRRFTRDGAFQLNSENELVTLSGARVQGFGVDENFVIQEGNLTDLNIPVGSLSIAEATTRVVMAGNLNVQEDLTGVNAPQGSQNTFGTVLESAPGVAAVPADLLINVENGAGAAQFVAGDTITLSGVRRGNKDIEPQSFTVQATSTVQDLLSFYQGAMGIVENAGFDPAADAALIGTVNQDGGVIINGAGNIVVTGNPGTFNELDFTNASVSSTGAYTAGAVTENRSAQGESIRHTVTVFDSVGTAISVDVTLAIAGEDGTGHYARVFLHSPRDRDVGDLDVSDALEVGAPTIPADGTTVGFSAYAPLVRFDNDGQIDPTRNSFGVEIDLNATGAADPLAFIIEFDRDGDVVTGFADGSEDSTLRATSVDGLEFGVLEEFAVQNDGLIRGFFTNGQVRDIGQVMIATFQNDEGLVDVGGNLYREGPNSGTAQVLRPTTQGSGSIVGGALELSNVDLSQEFINMILTSTGYNASSRVITTSDTLLQTLISLAR
ncbi:MAG: flagellar hook-basal body complex protein [Planctomycetota bacterium]